jgi:hypothetical protein
MMRKTLLLALLCLAAFTPWKAISDNRPGAPLPVDFSKMRQMERLIDGRIEIYTANNPFVVIGPTRAVYVPGTGVVYSAEINLIPTPGFSPFVPKLPEAKIQEIHDSKVQRLPMTRKMMRELLVQIASGVPGIPPNEEVILGLTFFYFHYENKEDLPRQMVLRAPAGRVASGSASNDFKLLTY